MRYKSIYIDNQIFSFLVLKVYIHFCICRVRRKSNIIYHITIGTLFNNWSWYSTFNNGSCLCFKCSERTFPPNNCGTIEFKRNGNDNYCSQYVICQLTHNRIMSLSFFDRMKNMVVASLKCTKISFINSEWKWCIVTCDISKQLLLTPFIFLA